MSKPPGEHMQYGGVTHGKPRPPGLRRSWMFVPGIDLVAQQSAIHSGADVVVADLEEFTSKEDRPQARVGLRSMIADCRANGVVAAVRINKLEHDGREDLLGIMKSSPDIIFLPHVETADQIRLLDELLAHCEQLAGIPVGVTEIAPTIESAIGLVNLASILGASARVKCCLLAAEDFSASLGAIRGEDGIELQYARSRFLLECTAAKCVAIDCPFTFRSSSALESDLAMASRLGFKSKCVVFPDHVEKLNAAFTPSAGQVFDAESLCAAYERQKLVTPIDLSNWIDAPRYNNARRLLSRHAEFEGYSVQNRSR